MRIQELPTPAGRAYVWSQGGNTGGWGLANCTLVTTEPDGPASGPAPDLAVLVDTPYTEDPERCFLAAMAAHAFEKGVGETVQAASFPSPWQKCDGSWILPMSRQADRNHPSAGSTGRIGADDTKPSLGTATTGAARPPIG